MKKIKATQDESGHWYLIPNELFDEFRADVTNEELIDSGEFDDNEQNYDDIEDFVSTEAESAFCNLLDEFEFFIEEHE